MSWVTRRNQAMNTCCLGSPGGITVFFNAITAPGATPISQCFGVKPHKGRMSLKHKNSGKGQNVGSGNEEPQHLPRGAAHPTRRLAPGSRDQIRRATTCRPTTCYDGSHYMCSKVQLENIDSK